MKNKITFGKESYRMNVEITPKISNIVIMNVDKRSLKLKDCYVCKEPLKDDLNNIAFLEIDSPFIDMVEEYGHQTCLEELFTED